jgi:outer membrane protein OmpA-like peptidoglycan-associated protein
VKYAHIPVLAALCVLAACATTPERVPQLEEARAKVQTLAQDPMVQQAASEQLADARNTLQQAEIALEKREPVGRVTHLSYLAARHADIGQARLDEARARAAIAKAEAERNRVLLAARSQEAATARLATEDARRAAEDARRATEAARLETSAAQIEARSEADAAELARRAADAARLEASAAQSEARSEAEAAEFARRALADLQAKETERGMVLTLSDVLFDSGAATLKPGAIDTINRLATFLEQNPEIRLIIEGHTDSQGSDAYNEDLSRRRGQAVANELVSRGISSARFEVVGRGEASPVADNTTAAGRQQNRRVEIVFSDRAGKFRTP